MTSDKIVYACTYACLAQANHLIYKKFDCDDDDDDDDDGI